MATAIHPPVGIKALTLTLLLFSPFSFASDSHDAHGAPGKGPAKEVSNSRQYQERVQKLNKVTEQVKNAEHQFQELVKKNEHSHSEEEKHALMEQMKSAYSDYSKNMDELIKAKDELRYRFPTGEDLNPHAYREIKKQTPKELEKVSGLNATLRDIKRYVEEKYRPFQPTLEEKAALAPVSEQKEEKEKKPERLRLER